jgi:hypothetical protein
VRLLFFNALPPTDENRIEDLAYRAIVKQLGMEKSKLNHTQATYGPLAIKVRTQLIISLLILVCFFGCSQRHCANNSHKVRNHFV